MIILYCIVCMAIALGSAGLIRREYNKIISASDLARIEIASRNT